tara:strand:+ start:71 stop:673 length:603 start_codon:yes stop_codon:yes gene_type:complete
MVHNLEQKVNILHRTPSDINEHLPTIIKYGQECDHITEMGVRGIVSTWGWLASAPKKFIAYDIKNPDTWSGKIQDVYDTAEAYNLDFTFIKADVLRIEIEETDLLFLDTLHVHNQLKSELKLHSSKARKYICFHDTTSYETHDELGPEHHPDYSDILDEVTDKQGLWSVVVEFLEQNKGTWRLKERFFNNNGFTIIERIK